MKTIKEIEDQIKILDKKRVECLAERDNSKNDCDYSVNQNLVMIYVMQIESLKWVLNESI